MQATLERRPQTATYIQSFSVEEKPVAIFFPGQGLPPKDICSYHQLLKAIDQNLVQDRLSLAQKVMDDTFGDSSFDIEKTLLDEDSPIFKDTSFVQPVVYSLSVLAWEIMQPKLGISGFVPKVMAGHSLGEYTALTASGVIPFEKGIEIVSFRGLIMKQACEEEESKLSSISGLSLEIVLDEICPKTNSAVALVNAPELIAVGSTPDKIPEIEQLTSEIGQQREKRVRVTTLPTAGAFHTRFMRVPAEKLEEFLLRYDFADPEVPMVANRTGQMTRSGAALRNHAVESMENPVLWTKSLATMREQVQFFIECGPGNSLTRLNILNGIPALETLNINNLF